MFLTAALALAGATNVLPLPAGSAPLRIGLVVLGLAGAIGLTIALDRPGARAYWQVALGTALILLPIVTLQASASRVPFVAIARNSAGPLVWLTLAAGAALACFWVFAAYHAKDAPENASLLFLPAGLMVPAILGAPGSLDESSALAMLGEASLVAGVVILLGLLSPANWRPVAGALALGAQFLLLWALGRRPVVGESAGLIVPASAVLLLASAVILTVVAPLGALFSQKFFQTVDEEPGGSRTARIPEKGARQSDR